MVEDARKTGLKNGLRQLTEAQLRRVLEYQSEMVLDTYNYDCGKFCPLAVAVGLETMQNPTNEKVYTKLTEMGFKVNNTQGILGNFYTTDRSDDLLEAAHEVLAEKTLTFPKVPLDTYYELTPYQNKLANKIADARYNNARSRGVFNAKVGDQSNTQTDRDGFGAELGFCHMFGTKPDFTVAVRSAANGTDPLDTQLHYLRNVPVDVKHTPWPNGRLLVRGNKQPGEYLFALMNGFFRFKGFAWASQVFVKENLMSNGSYAMGSHLLRTLEDVIADKRYNACLFAGNDEQ